MFEDFAPIFVNWVDDSNCWLTVKHDKKCEKLKEAKVSEFKFFQEFMEGKRRKSTRKWGDGRDGRNYNRSVGETGSEILFGKTGGERE